MKKQIKWLFPLLGVSSCFALVVSLTSRNLNLSLLDKNNTLSEQYVLNFSSSSNHIETSGSGTLSAKTVNNNAINFDYTDATVKEDGFVTFASGGSFFNNYSSSVVGNNRLSGVYSLTAEFEGTLKLDYTWNETFESEASYLRNGVNLTTGVEFTFGNETPSYLRLRATAETTITSISVKYSCSYTSIPDSVYKINNVNDLVNFTYLVNNGLQDLSAILMDDIDMKGTSYAGIDTTYTGTFDGNNHAITGLSFSSGTETYKDSLFAVLGDGGVIKNLDVTATLTKVKQRNAILVGEMRNNSTIKNCITRGSVSALQAVDEGVGGVVGLIASSTKAAVVDGCTNFATISSPTNGKFGRRAGGIVGGTTTTAIATITNNVNYGNIFARSFAAGIAGRVNGASTLVDGNKNFGRITCVQGGLIGGIVGLAEGGTITNNYSGAGYLYGLTGNDNRVNMGHTSLFNIDLLNLVGTLNKGTYNGVEPTGGTYKLYGYCVGSLGTKVGTAYVDDTNIAGWGGTSTVKTLTGAGTAEDPYQIVRAQDYFTLRSLLNTEGNSDLCFKLMKDIDLDYHKDDLDYNASTNTSYNVIIGTAASKTAALAYTGTFDGNNHKIYNFSSSTGANLASGLFANTNGATVKDVTFVNPTVQNLKGAGNIGVVTGSTTGITIDNVKVIGGKVYGPYDVGSLVGAIKSGTVTITNCSSTSRVIGDSGVGGLVGSAGLSNTTVNEAAATLTVKDSLFNGSVSSISSDPVDGTGVGGILGATGMIDTVIIKGCTNGGAVTSVVNEGVGGIFGKNVDLTDALYNHASTITIDTCKNYGTVTGVDSVGGVVGHALATTHSVTSTYNYGDVFGSKSSTSVGGIFGTKHWAATNCYTSKTATVVSGTYKTATAFANTTVYLAGIDEQTGLNTDCGLCEPEEFVAPSLLMKNTVTTVSAHLAHYGRYAELKNGKNIFTYSGGYFLSTTNGFTYGDFTSFKTLETEYVPIYNGNSSYVLTIANLEPLVLDDGRLVVFYRSMLKDVYSSIRARISYDNGLTFSSPIIILENYGSLGMYEPFGVIDDDVIQLFISCDISSTLAGGYGPDNTSLICRNGYQNIVRIPIDISSKTTFNIGNPTPVIKGTTNYRRPGMSVVSKLNDGSYAMVIEHNGTLSSTSNYKMRIAISYSKDLLTWTAPKDLILPSKSGTFSINGVSDIYRAQAPYIQVLPSGQIAVSYMTNEFYNGDYFEGDNDLFRTVELAVSTSKVSYNDTVEMKRIEYAGHHEYNHGSSFGSCKIINGELVLIYTDYKITNENFDRTTKGFSFSRIRIL